MRQVPSRERSPQGQHQAGSDAPANAVRWKRRLRRLACLVSLWQASAAMAVGLLEVVNANAFWLGALELSVPGVPFIEDFSVLDQPNLQSGIAAANSSHLDWEVQIDQTPGGGSLRTAGTMDMTQSMVYTLEHSSTTLATLRISALSQTAGQWSFEDGAGNFITDTPAAGRSTGYMSLLLRVDRPMDLRLSGRLWSTAALGGLSGSLSYTETGSGHAQFSIDLDTDPASFEYQWRVPGAGVLKLYIEDSTIHDVPCCNIAYSGSSGWDLTLEASALTAVPEPGPAALWMAGLGALAWLRRHRLSV